MSDSLMTPVTFSLTRPADTTAYAANDVVSDTATDTEGVARTPSPARVYAGFITQALITTSQDSNTARFRLWLFDSNPSGSELDDNAAFNLVAADREKLACPPIDFEACSDKGAVAVGKASVPSYWVRGGSGMVAILQTLDAFTPASAQTFTIRLN